MQSYAPLGDPVQPLRDGRLRRRLGCLVDTFAERLECSIPQATGNRNDMDAAYQFFKNQRVGPAAIVASCLAETLQRLDGCSRVLAVQDTSDLNYAGLAGTAGLGHTDGPGGRGLKLHSTLAVRADGVPAGLLTQQLWARDPKAKGRAKDRRQRQAPDKESYRWLDHAQAARAALPAGITVVHVADREGDSYDWLAAPRPAHAHLLVRVAQAHRVVVAQGPGGATGSLAEVVRATPAQGVHPLALPRADDRPARDAVLTLRWAAVAVQPPKNAKQRSQLRPVPVWVVEAREEASPPGSPALCWRLVTTEPVGSWEEALRVLREYTLRWLIERLHFVLKSGCRVEQLQLTEADRLANAVAVYSQVAARVLRLTYLARAQPQAAAQAEFTLPELEVLQAHQQRTGTGRGPLRTIEAAVGAVARLGGHLGRKGDGPPGAEVLWRGLRCLHDLVLGYQLAQSPPTG
jgi:Transposase DNA-binding/Transposase Tn5 dimerisation domain